MFPGTGQEGGMEEGRRKRKFTGSKQCGVFKLFYCVFVWVGVFVMVTQLSLGVNRANTTDLIQLLCVLSVNIAAHDWLHCLTVPTTFVDFYICCFHKFNIKKK